MPTIRRNLPVLKKKRIMLEFNPNQEMWSTTVFREDEPGGTDEPIVRKTLEEFIGILIPGVFQREITRVEQCGKYTAWAYIQRSEVQTELF